MKNIKGKSLIFSDLHYGRTDGSVLKIEICNNVIDEICDFVKSNNIENILFLGDWYHDRQKLLLNVFYQGSRAIEKLSNCANLYMIVGNHDSYESSNTEINSIDIYKHIPNINVISVPEDVIVNGKKCLIAPWGTNPKMFKKNSYEAIFGHLDFSTKCLGEMYIQNNTINPELEESLRNEISSDRFIDGVDVEDDLKIKDDIEYANSFLGIVKKKGTIFTGHIHNHCERLVYDKNLIFVGAPWQQTFGEERSEDGFYILNEDFSYKFIKINNTPELKTIYISDIIKSGYDNFDYSVVNGNTVKIVYDTVPDNEEIESKINSNIINNLPYTICEPEYKVKDQNLVETSQDFYNSITIGNWDFLENYLKTEIDDKVLINAKTNREDVLSILKEAALTLSSEE